ncbi:MAG: hypothetical protein ACYTFQ_15115, partial [Planctomycetota bacterium]
MRQYVTLQPSRKQEPAHVPPEYRRHLIFIALSAVVIAAGAQAANVAERTASPGKAGGRATPVQVNGVFPNLTVMAKGIGSDSEAGIGALIPWAEKLWAVGYVAHIRGEGLGLYEISENMTMRRHPASVTGTFANRMVHWP